MELLLRYSRHSKVTAEMYFLENYLCYAEKYTDLASSSFDENFFCGCNGNYSS